MIGGKRLVVTGLIFLIIPIVGTLFLRESAPAVRAEPFELLSLAILVLLRLGLSVNARRSLFPWLDLPILGLVFTATGAEDSPLDPALFLVYTLLAFYLEGAQRKLLGLRYYAVYLLGFVAMYGLLYMHVDRVQRELLKSRSFELMGEIDQLRMPFAGATGLFDRDELIAQYGDLRLGLDRLRASGDIDAANEFLAPHPVGDVARVTSLDGEFDAFLAEVTARSAILSGAARALSPERPWTELEVLDARMNDAIEASNSRILDLENRILDASEKLWRPEAGSSFAEGRAQRFEGRIQGTVFDNLAKIAETQNAIRTSISTFLWQRMRDFKVQEYNDRMSLRSLLIERFTMAILVLATLSLVAGLRINFEEEVRRREAARAEADVRHQQQETENWIALTAGLTHTIGNDILAYDAYGREALDALEGSPGTSAPVVERNLRFIHESNKARLAFIRFLDEFARTRKQALQGAPFDPQDLQRVDLAELLRETRERVGQVEAADLPRDSRDPRVKAQRAKLLELPLEVRFADFAPETRVLHGARPGILEFFCYELIKNALRNCSGREPIAVEVERAGDRARLRFVNDLEVAEVPTPAGTRYRLPRIADLEAASEGELELKVAEILERCFEPSRGGGTGLGLFLIRYFVREYYAGSITARIRDWKARRVEFTLEVPDDLGRIDRIHEPGGAAP